jgi:hypothetical protein
MAKKKHNVITDLVELIGEDNAEYVLGVHKNTIYKWTIPTRKKDSRVPNSAAKTLAAFYIFLIQTCGWTIDEIVSSVESSNDLLANYD